MIQKESKEVMIERISSYLNQIDLSFSNLSVKRNQLETIVLAIQKKGKDIIEYILKKSAEDDISEELINNLKFKLEEIKNINNTSILDENETIVSKEDLSKSFKAIVDIIDLSEISQYYMRNIQDFITRSPILYSSEIEPKPDKTVKPLIDYEHFYEENEYLQSKFGQMKNVEIIIIKKRRNATIRKLVDHLKDKMFIKYIMRKDTQNNITIKGIIKDNFNFFENYFLVPFEEFHNLDYVKITTYFNIIDLLKDFDQDYDKTNIPLEELEKIVIAGKELEKVKKYYQMCEMMSSKSSNF